MPQKPHASKPKATPTEVPAIPLGYNTTESIPVSIAAKTPKGTTALLEEIKDVLLKIEHNTSGRPK